MKKIISFVGLFAVLGVGIGDAHGVAMSAQVRRLLQEKQEKIEQLEKCEGKKQGWMIAGISTIGLTAVGVGVNIAQASKSNRLSDEIEMEKSTLERHENELNRINKDIANEQLRQRREECEKQPGRRWNENGYCEDVPGTGGGNDEEGDLTTYSDYVLSCKMTMFTFRTGQVRDDLVDALNKACYEVTKQYMERTETNGFVKYECKDYREKANCDKQQNDKECPDIKYYLPLYSQGADYMAKIDAKLEKYKTDCSNSGGDWSVVEKQSNLIGGGTTYICKGRKICKSGEEVEIMVVVDTDVNPVTPAKPDQNCRTSYGKKPTADCPCDEGKGLSSGTDGTCVCSDSNTKWNGQKCAKNSVEPVPPITPIPPKPTEPEYDEIDLKNCRLSGGEWRYRDQYKRWECFCGINQSGSDKNMVQTSGFKTCACKKDYIWIDDNDHSKGCKRGISAAENADLNKITNLYGRFERVVNSMDTKAGQAGRAATAASGASKAADARKYADQAKNYFDEINTLYMEAGALYEEINALISGLSTELRSKVSTYIKDADTLNSRLESIVQKARSAASEAEKAAVALENLAAAGDTCKTVQCQKCVDTGGKWEELVDGTVFCRCDRKQGLVSDSSKMLYCKPAN